MILPIIIDIIIKFITQGCRSWQYIANIYNDIYIYCINIILFIEYMYNGHRISDLIAQNKLTQQEAADGIGLSKSTLIKNMNADSTTAKTLEKIADFFKVPIDYFFDREVDTNYPKNEKYSVNIQGGLKGNNNVSNISIETHLKIVKTLEDLIADKERLIQILMNNNNPVGGDDSRLDSGIKRID